MTELLVKSDFIAKVALRSFDMLHVDEHYNVRFFTLNVSRSKLSEFERVKSSKLKSRFMSEKTFIVYSLKWQNVLLKFNSIHAMYTQSKE